MNNQKSKCCRSSVTAISSDEGTSYYQCNRCLQPTDVVTTSKSEEKCDVVSKLTEEDARKISNEFDPFTRLDKSEKTVKCDDCGKMLKVSDEVGVEGHFCTRLENWEERFLKEWNDAEGGVGLPNFLLPFISTLLQEERGNTRKMITGWVNAMWDLDILDHDDWTGPDEVVASIMSYVEGKHLQSNEK